jgi:ABC-type sulfate transport system permease subunit
MCTACTGADAHVMIWVVTFPNERWHGNVRDIYFCILCVLKLFGAIRAEKCSERAKGRDKDAVLNSSLQLKSVNSNNT